MKKTKKCYFLPTLKVHAAGILVLLMGENEEKCEVTRDIIFILSSTKISQEG
jgi:hypothetical protein